VGLVERPQAECSVCLKPVPPGASVVISTILPVPAPAAPPLLVRVNVQYLGVVRAATASLVTILAAFRLPAVGATNATCEVVSLTVPSGTMIGRLFAVALSFGTVTLAFRILSGGHWQCPRAASRRTVPRPRGARTAPGPQPLIDLDSSRSARR